MKARKAWSATGCRVSARHAACCLSQLLSEELALGMSRHAQSLKSGGACMRGCSTLIMGLRALNPVMLNFNGDL